MTPSRSHTSSLAAVFCAVVLPAAALAQTTATTNPVGFITLGVNAAKSGGTAITLTGLGLTQPILFQGVASSVNVTTTNNTSTIVDTSASWTDSQFNTVGSQWPTSYVEIASGPNAGVLLDIASTTAATQTITTIQPLPSGTAAGVSFIIRNHWTLSSVFGSSINQAGGLVSGASNTADLIQLYSGTTPTSYYYKTAGLPSNQTGWRKTTDAVTDVSNLVIYPDEGFVVNTAQTTAPSVVLMGAVKTGQTSVPISVGYNFVGNIYAAPLTFADSGLYTGSASTGIGAGGSNNADQVLIWNPTALTTETFYYKNQGLPSAQVGWRKSGFPSNDLGTPAAISNVSVGNPAIVTTGAAHGLTSGETVELAGFTDGTASPAINGAFVVTVLSANTFSVPVNVTASPTVYTNATSALAIPVGSSVIINRQSVSAADNVTPQAGFNWVIPQHPTSF